MNINKVKSVESYSLSYKAILCDLWGVIHNGVEIYTSALAYLCLLYTSPSPRD